MCPVTLAAGAADNIRRPLPPAASAGRFRRPRRLSSLRPDNVMDAPLLSLFQQQMRFHDVACWAGGVLQATGLPATGARGPGRSGR